MTSPHRRPVGRLALLLLLAAPALSDAAAAVKGGRRAEVPIKGPDLPWVKVEVDTDGVYTLTGAMLRDAGWPLAAVRADALRLTSQGDDVAFELEGAGGETLTPTTKLRFFGQRFRGDRLAKRYADIDLHWASFDTQSPDGSFTKWSPKLDATAFEKYTATNVYWLRADGTGGPHMGVVHAEAIPPPARSSAVTAFTDTVGFDEARIWYSFHFTGSDSMVWARANGAEDATQAFTLTLSGAGVAAPAVLASRSDRLSLAAGAELAPNSAFTATFRVALIARSNRRDHRSAFALNGVPLGEAVWHGASRLTYQASLPSDSIVSGANVFTWQFLPGGAPDFLYLDWVEVTYARDLDARGQALVMSLPFGAAGLPVIVPNLPGTQVRVYDISNPLRPMRFEGVTSELPSGGGLTAAFIAPASSTPGAPVTLWVGSATLAERHPLRLSTRPDPRPGLIGTEADYLVISPAALLESSHRLADYRTRTGYRTAVFSLADLYDAYNFGILHPIAIRNFLADAFATWQQPPKYLVLVGDGHWDMRGDLGHDPAGVLMPPNLSWVDPWQGEVDSANLLGTVADGDAVADLAIGRLPANTPAELDAVIDKIIAYEAAPPGDWQRQQLFVADNTDAEGDYQASSDAIVDRWSAGHFEAEKVYLGDYQATGRCQPGARSTCQDATDDIVRAIGYGAAIVNYSGHAALQNWTHEQIFVNDDISRVANGGRLPVILSWSCLDGFWDHPDLVSMAETWLRVPSDGAVAAFSATGLGVANGHDILQAGIYQAIYGDRQRILGDITLAAKRTLAATGLHPDLVQTYTLFGDPVLRIRVAEDLYSPVLLPYLFRP